jgi:hypothetical protein
MIVFVAGLLLAALASPSLAAVNAVIDSTWTSWSNTVYYFARLSGPNAPYTDLKVFITAVDRYALWVNGNRIDTPAKNDGKWETVEQYDVPGGSGNDIFIAVQVENNGNGTGNGLMVDVKTGSDWQGSTTMRRRSQFTDGVVKLYPATGVSGWYYYYGDIAKTLGRTDWYKFDAKFFDDAVKYGLKPVMLGKMGQINYTPDSHIEVITGYQGDIDVASTSGGGITLRRIEGENLALYKPAAAERLVDGDLAQGFQYQQDPMGSFKEVDLLKNYRVHKLVMYTGGTNAGDFTRVSVRGYSAEISLDDYRYDEVGTIQEIGITNKDKGGYEYSEVEFPPQIARYVRYRITATRTVQQPIIGEMMVFGTGYAFEGVYESPWLDMGSPTGMKNFKSLKWDGVVPEGTRITVQTRTLPTENGVASNWSPAFSAKEFDFPSPEPALKFQYRISFSTGDPDKTPVFKSLSVAFSKDAEDQPLASGRASVFPNSVPMNVDTSFVYTLSYKLAAGQNIQTVALSVPNTSTVDSLSLVRVDADKKKTLVKTMRASDGYSASSTNDTLYVKFPDTAVVLDTGGSEDQLLIYFRTKLLKNVHDFTAGVLSSTMANTGAGPVNVWEDTDLRWTVTTNTIMKETLVDVKAVPKVFTPNGDNRNDFTVIEFTLAKTQTRVKINIFSTDGTRVRELYDGVLSPTRYSEDNSQGRWDGKNDDKEMVPPGIYIYQVVADTDEGDKVKTGTVVVAY